MEQTYSRIVEQVSYSSWDERLHRVVVETFYCMTANSVHLPGGTRLREEGKGIVGLRK